MAYNFRQILDIMNSGEPFSCIFSTLDMKRKKGGEIRTIEARTIKAEEVLGRPSTEQERKEFKRKSGTRHIRNVHLFVNGHAVDQVRSIRIPLILKFNGEEVNP